MSRYITLDQLRRAAACADQLTLFEKTFGDRALVTRKRCVSVASMFAWDWAANLLHSPPARRAYDEAQAAAWRAYGEARAAAWRAYGEAQAAAWRAYQEAVAPARRAYDEARAPARRAYHETVVPAQRAYDEARATARRAYDEARATAFADAYNRDQTS